VIPAARGTLLECEPIEMRSIESVHSAPAISPVAYIRRNALLTCKVDEYRYEAVIPLAMDRR
jgi:hypothetical protein